MNGEIRTLPFLSQNVTVYHLYQQLGWNRNFLATNKITKYLGERQLLLVELVYEVFKNLDFQGCLKFRSVCIAYRKFENNLAKRVFYAYVMIGQKQVLLRTNYISPLFPHYAKHNFDNEESKCFPIPMNKLAYLGMNYLNNPKNVKFEDIINVRSEMMKATPSI